VSSVAAGFSFGMIIYLLGLWEISLVQVKSCKTGGIEMGPTLCFLEDIVGTAYIATLYGVCGAIIGAFFVTPIALIAGLSAIYVQKHYSLFNNVSSWIFCGVFIGAFIGFIFAVSPLGAWLNMPTIESILVGAVNGSLASLLFRKMTKVII
jgi:hypothetical protein